MHFNEDVAAWTLVREALDRALAMQVSDTSRPSMTRCRALASQLSRQPALALVPEQPRPEHEAVLRLSRDDRELPAERRAG
jgi:hypothetical protein